MSIESVRAFEMAHPDRIFISNDPFTEAARFPTCSPFAVSYLRLKFQNIFYARIGPGIRVLSLIAIRRSIPIPREKRDATKSINQPR